MNMPQPGPRLGGPAPAPAHAPGQAAGKVPSKKNTRVYGLGAALLGLLAFVVIFTSTSVSGGDTYVLRAKRAIPAMGELSADMFEAVAVEEGDLVEGAVTGDSEKDALEGAELEGRVAQYPISKGAQLTEAMFTVEAQLSADLDPQQRLVSIDAEVSTAVAGALRPGDHVDIWAASPQQNLAQLVITDVEIAAIQIPEDQFSALYQQQVSSAGDGDDKSPTEVLPTKPIPGMYTLKLNQSLIGRLAILDADRDVSLYLVYRGQDAESIAPTPIDMGTAFCAYPQSNTGEDTAPTNPGAQLPAACEQLLGGSAG